MEGRYRRLTQEILRQEARQLLAEIEKLPLERMSPQAIAVLPLRYQGADMKYAPLGKGISEMLIGDLGQVRQLKMVERIRLQTLLDEMALAQHPAFDKTTASQYGKLMGAGRIIAGAYKVLPQEKLQVDVLSWNTLKQQYPASASQSDLLQNLFRLEKDLVFKVVAEMGIELTPQEREKIQFVPTRNMQAFLAYCQGLGSEDAGKFQAAVGFYQQAKQLDPSFDLAASKAETAQSLSEAGGSKEQAVAVAQNADPPISPGAPTSQADLLGDRLRNLGENVGSNFVPGRDNREPLEEADRAYGELGKPPNPPPRP
jgi:TolB-like protein